MDQRGTPTGNGAIGGCVLVVHEPGVDFTGIVLHEMRNALLPMQNETPKAEGDFKRELGKYWTSLNTGSLCLAWFLTTDSNSQAARSVIAKVTCLSSLYHGAASDAEYDLCKAVVRHAEARRKVIDADIVIYAYRSDRQETRNFLPKWREVLDSIRNSRNRPPLECMVICIAMSAGSPRSVSEDTLLSTARRLGTTRSMIIDGNGAKRSDADSMNQHCVEMILNCQRRRSGLATQTVKVCPGKGCPVNAPHKHLEASDSFLGTEDTVVYLREEQQKHAVVPQVSMPVGSVNPRQFRTLISETPPVPPVPRVDPGAGARIATNNLSAPGVAMTERTGLLTRVKKT
jgi:hypothetical protein